MIFIGAELSDPHAHFVTNIIACIGKGESDLIIDLLKVNKSVDIFNEIEAHLKKYDEQYIIYNAYTDEDFFFYLKSRFPQLQLITVFSDDEWRHSNYDRYLALYADIFTIAVKNNLKVYENYGLKPFYMQWACNPEMFHPVDDKNKDIDVSFIGAAYGQRMAYIRFLIANDIKVEVFGKGWDKYADTRPCWGGYLSHSAMLEVISRSKINLNFLWTSADKECCTIKARTLELSACRAFQLSNSTDEFSNYGFVDGANIAVFNTQEDMLKKIHYFFQHDEKRDAIAQQAYEHALKYHTWQQRFKAIFEQLDDKPGLPVPIHHQSDVLVIVHSGVKHQINHDDERLNIHIVNATDDWKEKVGSMDGVICLNRDSTINNETLYMMVFGLLSDQSDIVAANFYAGHSTNRYWIRVVDRVIEEKRQWIGMLPLMSLMFSGKYVDEHGINLVSDLSNIRVSYIELPSFWIKLPYYLARKLRLYFAYHGDSRKQFKIYLVKWKFGKAISLGIDKVWQRALKMKVGV